MNTDREEIKRQIIALELLDRHEDAMILLGELDRMDREVTSSNER